MNQLGFLSIALLLLANAQLAWALEKLQFKFENLEAFVVREVIGQPQNWQVLVPSSGAFPAAGQPVSFLSDAAGTQAAINANFYREDQPGYFKPIGLLVRNGELLSEPHANWPAVGWSNRPRNWIWDQVVMDGKIDLLSAEGKVIRKYRFCRLNAAASFGCATLWTNGEQAKRWRAKNTLLVYLESKNSGPKLGTSQWPTVGEKGKPNWVLELPAGFGRNNINKIKNVTFDIKLRGTREGDAWNQVSDAVSGSHVFSEFGVFPPEKFSRPWAAQKQPRAVIGQDSSQRIFIAVFDGRRTTSEGVSVQGAWEKLREKIDAKWILNLDGGGSATLLFKKKLLNIPSDGIPRAVAVGLGASLLR